MNTAIICTAAGAPRNICEKMKTHVQEANGTVAKILILFTMRPNENNCNLIEIATEAGKQIRLP